MRSYVCVLSTDNYLDGILVINENLKRVKAKYPLVCLINENITIESKKILEEFEIEYKLIKNIKYANHNDTNSYWKYTFDKINVFSLTDYEKVIYLDADLLLLDNIDDLFEKDCPALPKDQPFNDDGYNSGLMVIEPNITDYEAMKNMAIEFDKQGRKISDQNIINEYFEKINALPYGYNMVRMILWPQTDVYNVMTKKYESRHNVKNYLLDIENCNKVIHYIGGLKPFMVQKPYNDAYYYLYSYYYHNVEKQKIKNKMEKSKISIIVPIYNREKYLAKCLDSIINQTHKNLEIILVNDGSSDNSINICKKYAKNDLRIIIINKSKNEGVSAARNKGLEIATGDYIGFVDSDDSILPNMYEKLLEDIIIYDTDFIQCGSYVNQKKLHSSENRIEIYEGNDVIVKLFLSNWIITSVVWDKLYKKSFLDKTSFNSNYRKNEDVLYIFNLVQRAKKIGLSNLALYDYTFEREDALTGDFYLEVDKVKLEFLDQVKSFITEYYPKYTRELERYLSYQYGEILDGLSKSKRLVDDKIEILDVVKLVNDFVKESDSIEHHKKKELDELMSKLQDKIEYNKLEDELNNLITENKTIKKEISNITNNLIKETA